MAEPESPKRSETEQSQYLLSQLVILTIVVIGLVLIVIVYPRIRLPLHSQAQVTVPTLRSTATASLTPAPSLTPTPTRTLRYTLTPTLTLSPTPSPDPSQVPPTPGPPTLIPARPNPDNKVYSLESWSADDADLMVDYMEDYPHTLPEGARGDDLSEYYAAFTYAVTALQEALVRFPEAPQAEQWQWMLAQNLARTGDESAAQAYADLIARALNEGQVTFDHLPYWFESKANDLDLYSIELEPPEGFYNSALVQIEGPGSIFLWLLEGPGAYQVYPLVASFDPASPTPMRALLSDLTGDGSDEVIIFPAEDLVVKTRLLDNDAYLVPLPRIFDLSQAPAEEYTFQVGEDQVNLGIEFENRWSIQVDETNPDRLVFSGQAFPACPLKFEFVYQWNGSIMERTQTSYDVAADDNSIHTCQVLLGIAEEFWGPQATLNLIEKLEPYWPPTKTPDGTALTLVQSADLKDELQFKLGVNAALIGDLDRATRVLTGLANDPANPEGPWGPAAQQFLAVYQKPEDVYRACLQATACKPGDALAFLGTLLTKEDSSNPLAALTKWGVVPVASGYADFDREGSAERWVTVRHRPLEVLDFWILAETKDGPRAVRVDWVDVNRPIQQITALGDAPEEEFPAVIRLDNERLFSMKRQQGSLHPVIAWVKPEKFMNLFERELLAAEKDLMSGVDPAEIAKRLVNLETYPGLLCKPTWSCDRYYYLIGLAREMANLERQAVEAYLTLWRNYSRSPFTIMARLKLKGEGISLATPIPSGTPSPTPSPTPTITGTPPTPTPTIEIPYQDPYVEPYP
jgi:hypothetical protein